ncbi:MAG: glycerol-3-phosphate 1-O-acyltransferase PlsY [Candidatus Caldarchaeum sp.]
MNHLFLGAILAFLLGSIPFGFLIARTKKIDIRHQGSGNIGATNVYRTLGAGPGLLTLALDFAKGFLTTFVTLKATEFHEVHYGIMVGTCAVIGHMFSPLLAFKGGRGVATGLGVVLAATPEAAGIALILWLPLLLLTQYMSLASLVGAWSIPISAYTFSYGEKVVLLYILIAILVTLKHSPNIRRLLQGTEHRLRLIPPKTEKSNSPQKDEQKKPASDS